jgi:predicted transcriptional regulator
LANLRKKGFVEPVPSLERGFRLRPLVSRDAVVRRSLKGLVSGLFNGSPRQMISWLIKDENLDEQEIEEIRRMIEAHKEGKAK